jgi:hypothetical protein
VVRPLSRQRKFVTAEPDETLEQLVARVFPDESADTALEKLKSWNLHIFMRRPPVFLLGSDVVFVEPPAA